MQILHVPTTANDRTHRLDQSLIQYLPELNLPATLDRPASRASSGRSITIADGVIVFFNDPLPTPEPAKRAIAMAIAMREAAQQVLKTWRRHGHDLGFSVGISQGFATLGQIGFAERMDYTAIGQ